MRKPLHLAGRHVSRLAAPPEVAPAKPGTSNLSFPKIGGLALTLLILIPATSEFILARGNLARAAMIAHLVPPAQLGTRLLPVLGALVLGGLTTAFIDHAITNYAASRAPAVPRVPRMRFGVRSADWYRWLAMLCGAPVLMAADLAQPWGVVLVLFAFGAMFVLLVQLAGRDWTAAPALVVFAFSVLVIGVGMYVLPGFAPRVFVADGREAEVLLQVTDTGVWVVNADGVPHFVRTDIAALQMCETRNCVEPTASDAPAHVAPAVPTPTP